MPRYLAVAPTFNPIDYRTRIQPLEQYKEEYDKRLDALDEQGVLADAIGGLIDEQQDPELARIYKDYSNKMNTVASDLLRTGDLRSSRQSLRELRSDYANKLVPIQQAFNSRAEAGKAFRNAKMKDPSLRGNDPLSYSLSDYMGGKNPDVFTVSGDRIYAEGLADAKAQVSRVENVMKDWGLDPKLGSQYFSRLVANGYSADQVSAALAQMAGKDITDPSSLKAIQGVNEVYDYIGGALDRLYSSSGVNNLENSADQKEIMGRALNGILAGISYYESSEYKNYDPSFWVDAELKKIKLRNEQTVQQESDNLPYDLVPLTEIQGDKEIAKAKEDRDFLSQMRAHPEQILEERSVVGPQAPSIGNARNSRVTYNPNFDRIERLAKRYNIDINGFGVTNDSGKIVVSNPQKLNELIDRITQASHREAALNIAEYNTTKNDNLINKINQRSITSRDIKKENKSGRAELTGEKLPEDGTFRLNPWMKDNELYYEYVVRDDKGNQTVYRVGPDAIDSTPIKDNNGNNVTTVTRYWLEQYKNSIQSRDYNSANIAMHNAMILAYGTAEQKAKVRSTTDSKL